MKKKPPSSSNRDFLLVGITGGIGSGKSSVCSAFKDSGRAVISADEIARSLTATHPEVQMQIRKAFGDAVFSSTGVLDRKQLAVLAFSSASSLIRLNTIVHPHVFSEIELQVRRLPVSRRRPFVLIEAALIFESGMHKQLDRVLLVQADEHKRVERVIRRDNTTEEAVRARMKFQLSDKQKSEMADFVIINNGPESALKGIVEFYDRLLTTIAGPPAS